MNVEQEIQNIKERNQKVGLEKAWEVSLTRRVFISAVTYLIAVIWLLEIGDTLPWLKACVPAAGYLLSTLSLPILKDWWISKNK